MIAQTYEHHLELREDKFCPFKFKSCDDVYNSVCNWHNNIELLLVTGGSGRIQYGTDDFPIEEHDIIIVNSDSLHRVYSDSGVSFTYVIIDESFCLENGVGTKNRSFERCFKSDRIEAMLLASHALFDGYKRESTPINAARLRMSVLALLIELCDRYATAADVSARLHSASEKYVKVALEYLAENYADPISLEEIAARCGVTKYHLARVFKVYTGDTIFRYVNILRCKRAEACISSGMTVTEAARECGFESPSYFSRTYKRLMGKVPSAEKEK